MRKFESMDEFYDYINTGHEVQVSYQGHELFISSSSNQHGTISPTIATNHQNENPVFYDNLDDLLDNYKIDGRSIREFILDVDIEYIY